MTRVAWLAAAVGFVLLVPHLASAQAPRAVRDVTYATVDGKQLRLDIYVPAGVQAPPVLVWVHGGVWAFGTKEEVPLEFVANGIATASIDFRQSTEARFFLPSASSAPWHSCGEHSSRGRRHEF